MVLNNAKSLMLGSNDVLMAYVGDVMVYPWELKYLEITPTTIWLTEANNYTENVEVVSNTTWEVNNNSVNN